MILYFMLEEVIHVLEQWFPTFFIPIPVHKHLLLISPLLMSYVGCTGTLMAETDLVEVFYSTFGDFPKLLNRKKVFPECMRSEERSGRAVEAIL